MSEALRVGVIGAGIVGLSTALWLQRAGIRQVTLIDRAAPGSGTSFGNAGVFAEFSRVPYTSWKQLKQLPFALRDKTSPIAVRRNYLPNLWRYATEFARACTPSRFEAGCVALTQLQQTASDDTYTLVTMTGATSLVRDDGVLSLSSSAEGLERALAGHIGLRERLGAHAMRLNAADAAAMEPGIGPFHAGGVYYPDARFTLDPHALCVHYAEHFVSQGGQFLQAQIHTINASRDSCSLMADGRSHAFDHVIVCAGVEGARLSAGLGCRLPLVSERGYHLMLDGATVQLNRPVAWLEKSVYLTPMRGGIRAAGIAEFASPDEPPNEDLYTLLENDVATMLGKRVKVLSKWIGARPSTPDSLPIMGRVPGQPAVTLALGHGHLGLTFAAVTGRMVAESVVAGRDTVEMRPFTPARFS
ncbi:NAD(P)/FAD-dependent oxidoreductase [Bordetella sp. 02P26C-1]|uniref:NAD(P)/FAD-dependent oxidoreductase n=1 Tax=Bordetella sp. 02P26C-1 TaxID=2683195 RepID=UPI0013556F4D|nr:FAD-dependent oxidoreductase [Bordetella sp. 02P26C-1]MVW78196.1 FAD-dependent oxidoreductase [Bordetella sp. 02P26C-1]